MENRKKLHDYGLALVIIGILNLFMFGTTIVAEIIDGSAAAIFATVDANIIGAVMNRVTSGKKSKSPGSYGTYSYKYKYKSIPAANRNQ